MNHLIKPIGIFGGTFDPIHNGHLYLARELYQQLDWQAVRFIPCQQPVLAKQAYATAQQRLTMLKLALANQPNWLIDERELKRSTPSYMIDTLSSLRAELPNIPLCLILGSDNLANLPQWHRWQELIALTHFVVAVRPGYALPTQGPVADLLQKRAITNPQQLQQQAAGSICISNITPPAISATQIRQQIAQGLTPHDAIPAVVWQYIQQQHLYKQ